MRRGAKYTRTTRNTRIEQKYQKYQNGPELQVTRIDQFYQNYQIVPACTNVDLKKSIMHTKTTKYRNTSVFLKYTDRFTPCTLIQYIV